MNSSANPPPSEPKLYPPGLYDLRYDRDDLLRGNDFQGATMKIKDFARHNAALVAGISLPIVVVIFFLLATSIPRWLVDPPQ